MGRMWCPFSGFLEKRRIDCLNNYKNTSRRIAGNQLHQSFNCPYDNGDQKHDDRDLVDSVHHFKIEVSRPIWIWLLKNPNEVISYFA